MNAKALLATLKGLEVALHRPEVRGNPEKLEGLLHPDFREFGRSGRVYTRAEILAEVSAQQPADEIWSQDFQVEPLAEGLALLTYKSAHVDEKGELVRHTLRSSLWQFAERGWRMRFHQGTATEAFQRVPLIQ